jgi:hypothetical protein
MSWFMCGGLLAIAAYVTAPDQSRSNRQLSVLRASYGPKQVLIAHLGRCVPSALPVCFLSV